MAVVVLSNFNICLFLQAASDVYAPISGEVVEVNEKLTDEPALVRRIFNY